MYLNEELPKERLCDFSPLYLYMHIVLQKIFPSTDVIVQWLQIVLLGFSSVLLFYLLFEFFQLLVALFGTVAFILNYSVVIYTQVFEPEPLLIFFLLGFVFFAARSRFVSHGIAGFFFGLSFLTRPNFLAVLVAVPFYFYFRQGKKKRKCLISTALFLAPVLLCIGILSGRNAVILKNISPMTMNPGTVFFEGNNPNSWGMSSMYPPLIEELSGQYPEQPDYQHELYRMFARRIAGRNLSVPEVNSYWASRAKNFITDHPMRFVRLLGKKLLHFFHAYEWHDLLNTYWNGKKLRRGWIPTIPFALISAMALFGMLIQRTEWKRSLLFYIIFFCQFILMLVAYVSSRQRVAVIFIFVFFACSTLQYLIKSRKRLWVLPLLALFCLLLYVHTDFMREEDHLWESTRASRQFLRASFQNRGEGHFNEAARLSAMAAAAAPWSIDSRRLTNLSFGTAGFVESALRVVFPQTASRRFDRAALYIEAGKADEAAKIIQQLIDEGHEFKRDYYQSSEPYFYLGRTAAIRENRKQSVELLQKALERTPGDPSVLAHLSALTGRSEYRDKLFRYFDDISAHFYLGRAHLKNKMPAEAVDNFLYVTRKIPEFRRGHIYLAAALGEAGRYEEAARKYIEGMSLAAEPVMLEEEIISVFQKLSEQSQNDVDRLYDYGVVLRQFGFHSQALRVQREGQVLDASNPRTKQEIASLEKILLLQRERE
jgi:tetratricopeptide (TPR) repeat protein